ncbi:MAG: penicillin-binding protein 2 [Candidatus Accumulibacter sp.]|jgi:cell division protein FtsI (penicillin-binding protein 3)|nr:penicillin-binding protein 2 [Accumulibacter sp.]
MKFTPGISGARAHKFAESPVLKLRLPAWRSRLLALSILSCFAALAGRSFYLQVLNNDFLQKKGESRYYRDIEISASRGSISDRNGDVLALSTPMQSVWADPAKARSMKPEQQSQLAGLLDMDIKELQRQLASDKSFVYLKRRLPPETGEKVAAWAAKLDLDGIGQEREFRRYYPAGGMTAHTVGYTHIVDDRGQEGIELAFQEELQGHPGRRSLIKDGKGRIVEDVGAIRPPLAGRDIRLALDSKIQFIAFSQLQKAVGEFKAKAGSIVVADVRTGEILALANWPTYNPNNRERLSWAQIRNRALVDVYEPGSVMKPFTAALALETHKVRFDTPINCAGRLAFGAQSIADAHPHGTLSVAQVIQKSSNVGMAKIAAMLRPEQMWTMFRAIGLGQSPGTGFPGEEAGILRPWKSWRPVEQATMSYGHGLSVSLMQLARAYTVFAREGDIIPLTLTRSDEIPARGTPVFSARTAREIRAMLEMATQPGGTAPKAQVPGYRVGGKTGTAEKYGSEAEKYVASFVGFAPLTEPRLVVAVMIDEPAGAHYGGDVAGPVFSAVMGGSLRVLGVRPDAPVVQAAAPAVPTAAPERGRL